MRWAAIISVIMLLFAEQALAQGEWRRHCPSPSDADAYSRCILKLTGAEEAARIRSHGGELIRAFVFKDTRINSPILVMDAILTRDGDARLILRDALTRSIRRSYVLERPRFEALRDRVRTLRFGGAKLHGAVPQSDPTRGRDNFICLHPASAFVETVLDGQVANALMDYCSDEDAAFIDDFLKLAASQEPVCMAPFKGWPADDLRNCLSNSRRRADSP